MGSEDLPKTSATVSVHEQEMPWRRKSTRHFFIFYCLILIVVLGVYYTVLFSEYIELPIDDLLISLSNYCPTQGVGKSDLELHREMQALPLPPATFGVGVWVDKSSILPIVHSTLRQIEQRLSDIPQQPNNLNKTVEKKRYIYHFVHMQAEAREEIMLTHSNTSDVHMFQSQTDAIRALSERARSQQMGLRTFKHAFNPDLTKEMQMIALSIFSLPANLFGFVQDPQTNSIWCHTFDVLQSFCVVLADTQDQSGVNNSSVSNDMQYLDGLIEKDVTAGIASVLAESLSIDSFRPDDVRVWDQLRSQAGCLYTMRSLWALRDTLRERLNMRTHHKLQGIFTRVQHFIREGEFVLAARAADDLQFYPLLAPDVFLPLDYELTCHAVVLLPFIFMACLGASFELKSFFLKKRCKKA